MMQGKAASLSIRVLGTFRVSVSSGPIAATSWRRRAASLVKLLAITPGHRVHREEVLEALWPDSNPETASNNLHQALYVARRTLGQGVAPSRSFDYLRLQGDVIELASPDELEVDLDTFLAVADTARRARSVGAYNAAIALYHGDVLPGDRYEDWATGRREEARGRYQTLLLEVAQLLEERGDHLGAAQALERIAGLDPTHEEAQASLMRLYALTGRPAQALRQYQQLEAALREELDVQPATSTRDLYRAIAAGRLQAPAAPAQGPVSVPPAPAGRWPDALPVPPTPFIGRGQEMARAIALLGNARLLTLTGAGGTGKTRLALQVAAALYHAYPDGVCFVELAHATDSDTVIQAVAAALRLRDEQSRTPTETVVAALRTRSSLLILDNCEHVVAASSILAETLLRHCSRLRLLATSRLPLGARGEAVWPLPAMALPPDLRGEPAELNPEQMGAYDAVHLFVDSARLVRPGFALSAQNATAVVRICRRLEGIPLAIELGAARANVLTAEEIATRLEGTFAVLPAHRAPLVPHHRTLTAAIDWSHALLGEREQTLFRRLGVFANGWSSEAAEAVCADPLLNQDEILDGLSALVDASLVQFTEHAGEGRHRFLESIRQYAAEKLSASGELEALQARHAAWSVTFSSHAYSSLKGPDQEVWMHRLDREHDNLRAALRWAIDHREMSTALDLAGDLGYYWHEQGYLREGSRWLSEIIADSVAVLRDLWPRRARVLNYAGILAYLLGQNDNAVEHYQAALGIWRALDDRRGIAQLLANLGMVAHYAGDYQQAARYLEEALPLIRETGDRANLAATLNELATLRKDSGDHTQAVPLYEESLALFRAEGNRLYVAGLQENLADVACLRGRYADAARAATESLLTFRELGDKTHVIECLELLARIARCQGELGRAAALLDEALRLSREVEDPWSNASVMGALGRVALERGDVQEAVSLCAQSLAMHRELDHRQAVAAVLATLAEAAQHQQDWQRAGQHCAESLAIYRDMGSKVGIIESLEGIAGLAVRHGRGADAAALLCAAATSREAIEAPLPPADAPAVNGALDAARARLTASAFSEAWAEGQSLDLDQAAARALDVLATLASSGPPAAEPVFSARVEPPQKALTERELAIARSIASGSTNRQIAAELHLSPRTVDTHVSRILAKLGCESRAQVAERLAATAEQRSHA